MIEKDFARMPIKDLKAYCKELEEELARAKFILRTRKRMKAKLCETGNCQEEV